MMIIEDIHELYPAEGWFAEYKDRESGAGYSEPLVFWALVTWHDNGDPPRTRISEKGIAGMVPGECEVLVPAWDVSNFYNYTKTPLADSFLCCNCVEH